MILALALAGVLASTVAAKPVDVDADQPHAGSTAGGTRKQPRLKGAIIGVVLKQRLGSTRG